MKGVKKAVGIFKTVVIYILTFSMLFFAGIYINARQNPKSENSIPLEKLKSLENLGYIPLSKNNEALIVLPAEYVVQSGGNKKSCFGNYELMQTLIKKNKEIISSLFDGNAAFEKIEEGRSAEIWNGAFGQDTFLYLKFHEEMLTQILYEAYTENGASESSDGMEGTAVYEMVIIPSGLPEILSKDRICSYYYAIIRDKGGNITKVIPASENTSVYNSADLIAYNVIEGIISCDFLENYHDLNARAKTKGIKLPAKAIMLEEDTQSFELSAHNPIVFTGNRVDISQGSMKNFFDMCDFNTEKAKNYFLDNADTYIADHGTLKFYRFEESVVEYYSKNNFEGLNLSKILGYTQEKYSFRDKINAANIFINSLREHFAGENINIQLTSVLPQKDGSFVFEFFYFYDNFKIYKKDGSPKALTLTMNGNIISGIKFYPVMWKIKEGSESSIVKNMSQTAMFGQIINDIAAGTEVVVEEFAFRYFTEDGSAAGKWMADTRTKEVEGGLKY